jgi:hypothetical protein
MHSMKKRFTHRREAKNRPQFTLERLDPRILLNATADWLAAAPHTVAESTGGFQQADLYYSDPFLWNNAQNSFSLGQDIFPLDPSQNAKLIQSMQLEYPAGTSAATQSGASLSDLISGASYASAATSSSGYTLYLDFDGGRVNSQPGDFWLGSNYVDVPAFSLSAFGWAGREQESIGIITDFVREDYAAYHVNVTTVKPTSGDYTTMYVGGGNDWFRPGSGVIGVATYDVGNDDPSNYGFAFTDELDVYLPYCSGDIAKFSEYVANLVSHEAAHTFGANHINDVSELMNPYLPISPRKSMFGVGTISGSSAAQDTQSLLGANLGYAHGPDDYSGTVSTAHAVSLNSNVTGMLERRDDKDAFKFTAAQDGNVIIDVDTPIRGNLDSSLLVVRNSDLTTMVENNDYAGQSDSSISLPVQAGQSYTVILSSFLAETSGTYTLKLSTQLPDPEPQILVTDDSGVGADHAVDFGGVTINTTHSAAITITNAGSANLVISRLTASAGFEMDTVCTAANAADDLIIAPGGSRAVHVIFEPSQPGNYAGQLAIYSNDSDQSPMTVALSGMASPPQPNITLLAAGQDITAGQWNFGDVTRGQTAQRTFTIANTGQSDLTLTGLTLSGPFTLDGGLSTLPLTLAPAQTAAVILGFTPNQRGVLDGAMIIASNDTDEPILNVDLTAQVIGGVLAVQENSQTPNDNRMDFGQVRVADASVQSLTLVNLGDAPLTLKGLAASGGFQLDVQLDANLSADDLTLDPGEQIIVAARFSPNQKADYTGVITVITDNIESPTTSVQLSGSGVAGILVVTELDGLDNGRLDAGAIQTGQTRSIDALQISNHGNTSMTVALSLLAGDDFKLTGPAAIVLAPGQSQTISLSLRTDWAGPLTDMLTLTADDLANTSDTLALTADGYAVVGNGQRYQFTDHTGDLVTISLSGESLARVTLDDNAAADIRSINLISGSGNDTLSVKVKGGGRTLLGEITGGLSLKAIKAQRTDLVGAGIDIDGNVQNVQLGNVLAGADIAFDAVTPASLRFDQVMGSSDIAVRGGIRNFCANNFSGGSLQADSIAAVNIQGQLNADLNVLDGDLGTLNVRRGDLAGDVNVNGSIGKVNIGQGNLLAELNANIDIDRIMLSRGCIEGQLTAGQAIGRINALNIHNAAITAESHIDQILVQNEMSGTLVAVGTPNQQNSGRIGVLQSDPAGAWLGTLKVNGAFTGTTVAVGVAPDSQGNFINGSAAAATGMINTVDLRQVNTQNGSDPFGLCVKDAILKARVNLQNLAGEFHQDDFYINILNS